MKKWHVKFFVIDEEGQRLLKDHGNFYADTAADAKECALDAWWDPRWRCAGCVPDFGVEEIAE
jgi:hypothetical protein